MNKPASEVTPEQQLAQVAAILARGVLRLKQTARRDENLPSKVVPESSQEALEVGENPRLSGSRRFGFYCNVL